MKLLISRFVVVALVMVSSVMAQTLGYSGTPALLNNVTLSMHGTPNQPYVLAASDSPGPTVVAPLGSFDLGYPPIIIAGAIPGLPVVPALDASGNMSMTFNIPFNTSLIGTTWWFQAIYFDPASPYGISMTNGTHFTIADPFLAPTITSITPSSGPAAGGTQVAIMGTNFLPGGTTVTVGPNALLNPTVATPTLILGTIPPGTPGSSANVTVTTLVGGASVLAGGFTYLGNSAPTIASISPTHAPISGGGIFTLTGQGLGLGTTVYLNGVACIALSQSPTSYVGIIPNTATPGYATLVAVSTAGVGTLSNVFRYTIVLDVGNGSDGAFAPTSNVLIDTTVNGGVFNYTSFTIPIGVTVTARGPNPLVIKCLGDVTIAGTLGLKGENGILTAIPWIPSLGIDGSLAAMNAWPLAGAGGFWSGPSSPAPSSGIYLGIGSYYLIQAQGPGAVQGGALMMAYLVYPTTGGGPGFNPFLNQASHGTTATAPPQYAASQPAVYGNDQITSLRGGSGGTSGFHFSMPDIMVSPGGSGGGCIECRAGGLIDVEGIVDLRGGNSALGSYGNGGSGGALKLAAIGEISVVSSSVMLQGGTSLNQLAAGNGRWAIRSWNGTLYYGTESTVPVGTY